MTPERWQRVRDLFEAALPLEPATRARYVAEAAADDTPLAEEVIRLLASDEKAAAFLSTPPGAVLQGLAPGEAGPVTVGRHIGPYRVLGEISHGGMGAVYRAVRDDDQYQKQVAIKLIRGGLGPDFVVDRFKAERQILANLEHPNIARLIDGGTTEEGWPWFSMECVEGEPIDRYCGSRDLSTKQRLELFVIVCSAVQYAHQRLVIHRDLKPGNVLVAQDGTPKLLDFGIAKLLSADRPERRATVTGFALMTPEYASPEQVRGDLVTTASDVYSLGILLYELLAGRRAYEIETGSPDEIARVVCQMEPARPSAVAPRPLSRQLAGDLDTIVMKAVRKEAARRYASVQELSDDIRRHLSGRPVMARGDALSYRAGKFVRRHRVGVAAAAVVLLSLVGGILATARQARIAKNNQARAERRFNDVRKLANTFMFEIHDAIQKLPGSTPARKLLVSKALEYLDGLAQEASGDRGLQQELATAYERVGDVQGNPYNPNLGDTAGAVESYRKALAIRESLAAADPGGKAARRQLAQTHMMIASVLDNTTRTGEVREHLEGALRLYEKASADDPADPEVRRDLEKGHSRACALLPKLRLVGEAVPHCKAALAIAEELAAKEPRNLVKLRDLAINHQQLGRVLLAGDAKNEEGLSHLRKGTEVDEERVKIDPNALDAHRELT